MTAPVIADYSHILLSQPPGELHSFALPVPDSSLIIIGRYIHDLTVVGPASLGSHCRGRKSNRKSRNEQTSKHGGILLLLAGTTCQLGKKPGRGGRKPGLSQRGSAPIAGVQCDQTTGADSTLVLGACSQQEARPLPSKRPGFHQLEGLGSVSRERPS